MDPTIERMRAAEAFDGAAAKCDDPYMQAVLAAGAEQMRSKLCYRVEAFCEYITAKISLLEDQRRHREQSIIDLLEHGPGVDDDAL